MESSNEEESIPTNVQDDKTIAITKTTPETEAQRILNDLITDSQIETLRWHCALVSLLPQLCDVIIKNKSLTKVELTSSSCGSLLKFLPNKNPSPNDFNTNHPSNLFYALCINSTITNLAFSFTRVYNSLILGLVHLFLNNTTITRFSFEVTDVPSSMSDLLMSLSSNKVLIEITISATTKHDIVPSLQILLQSNQTLQSITLKMGHISKEYHDRLKDVDPRVNVIATEIKDSSSTLKKKNKKKKKKKKVERLPVPPKKQSNDPQQTEVQSESQHPVVEKTKPISFAYKQKIRDIFYDIISTGESNSLSSQDLKNVLSEFQEFSIDVQKSNKWTVTLMPSEYLEGFRLHKEQLFGLYQYVSSLLKTNKDSAMSNFNAWIKQQSSVSLSFFHFLELFPHTFVRQKNFLELLPPSELSKLEQEIVQLTPNTPIHYNSNLFRSIIQLTSQYKNIKQNIVEKDYYATYILSCLSKTGFKFVLKGGTSLAKSWRLLPRVCEDVDLHIVGTESWANDVVVYAFQQFRKLRSVNFAPGDEDRKDQRKATLQFIGEQIWQRLTEIDERTFKKFEIMFDRSCQQLQLTVFYDPLFGPQGEEENFLLFPWIRIEISLDHVPDYYYMHSTIKSFVGEYIQDSIHLSPLVWFLNVFPLKVDFLSLDPRLTLMQKLFDCIILRYRRDLPDEEIPYYSTPWVVPKSLEPQFDPRIVRHYEDAAYVLEFFTSDQVYNSVDLFEIVNKQQSANWQEFFNNIRRQRLLRRNTFLPTEELFFTEPCFLLQDKEKLEMMQLCQKRRSCLYYSPSPPPSVLECAALIQKWFKSNFVQATTHV